MVILISFAILGVILWLSPPFPEAIWIGAGVGLATFLVVRIWQPILAAILFTFIFTMGALFTFLASDPRAVVVMVVTGVITALGYHNTLIWLGVVEKVSHRDINHDGVIGAPEKPKPHGLESRREAALRYVFGYTNANGDTFKRRIARDNITAQGFMSQREWAAWVDDLEDAGVVECVNAQITKPLSAGYGEARNSYKDHMLQVLFTPDPVNPGRMVRNFNEERE